LDEYFTHISKSIITPDNELIILAAHPWHLVEGYKKGKFDKGKINSILTEIKTFLINLKSLEGTEFIRLDKYIKKVNVDSNEIVIEN
jgi:hypothetical protein